MFGQLEGRTLLLVSSFLLLELAAAKRRSLDFSVFICRLSAAWRDTMLCPDHLTALLIVHGPEEARAARCTSGLDEPSGIVLRTARSDYKNGGVLVTAAGVGHEAPARLLLECRENALCADCYRGSIPGSCERSRGSNQTAALVQGART